MGDFKDFFQPMEKVYGIRIKARRMFGIVPVMFTRSPAGIHYRAFGFTLGQAKRRLLNKTGALPIWSSHDIPKWMR